MVGELLVFNVWRHEGPQCRHHVPWTRVGNQIVKETKYQHVESYIVGEDDTLPGLHWMRYFIEAQGLTVYEYVMYQEKLSVILLEKNECKLGSQSTKHIQVHYFFYQRSYCGWGRNFGTLPNDKYACRSLHKTSAGIDRNICPKIVVREYPSPR